MKASTFFQSINRGLLTLMVAVLLALAATYAPVAMDNLAGTTLVTTAHACPAQGTGCG